MVLHLVYGNERSAQIASHRQHGYAIATCTNRHYFESKDAFLAFAFKAFEQFFDEMKK